MPAALFDLDGVLYEGDKAIAGAVEVIDWFVKNNIPHIFLTNTSSRPRSSLVKKLSDFGINSKIEQFLTPPLAAIDILKKHECKRLALYIPDITKTEFSAFDICSGDEVDAVVIGDIAQDWSFDKLNEVFQILLNHPDVLFVALGMTRYWRNQNKLQLDVGPFISSLEYATGRTAIVTGKPAIAFYQAAINRLTGSNKIVMIGDDIRGDIEAAQKCGLKAVLVRTGKFSQSDLELGVEPDAVLDSIADLPGWWQSNIDL